MFKQTSHITQGQHIELLASPPHGYDFISLVQNFKGASQAFFSKRRFFAQLHKSRKTFKPLPAGMLRAPLQDLKSLSSRYNTLSIGQLYGILSAYAEQEYDLIFSAEQDRTAWSLLTGGAATQSSDADTIVVTVVSAVLALRGHILHILAKDDHTARLAFEQASSFLKTLNIQSGYISRKTSTAKRGICYAKPIVFLAASEIIMDYLRDQVATGGTKNNLRMLFGSLAGSQITGFQRTTKGLPHAIVVDGKELLLDAALTSIMVNEKYQGDAEGNLPHEALGLAWQLRSSEDFKIEAESVHMTRKGMLRISILTRSMGHRWSSPARSEFMIRRALETLHIWKLGEDYSIEGEELQALNSVLEQKLQLDTETPTLAQFLATREGRSSRITGKAAARITFRRFFQRYSRLSALVTDLELEKNELNDAYHLRTLPWDTNPKNLFKEANVYFSDKKLRRKIHILNRSKTAVFLVKTDKQAEATKIAHWVQKSLLKGASVDNCSSFDNTLNCIWITSSDNLTEILIDLNILPTDRHLIFLTTGASKGHFRHSLDSQWQYHWLVQMNAKELQGKLNRVMSWLLLTYAKSSLPGSKIVARGLHRHVLEKQVVEQRELRNSLMKLDHQYRKMISFAGSGN